MKNKRIVFFLSAAFFVLICFIIFKFSGQNGEASGNVSEGFTRILFPSIVSESIVRSIESIIRKIAHYMIYLSLGISAYFAYDSFMQCFLRKQPRILDKVMLPLLICFAYSITDEVHQSFVPGRNGAFSDCLLDTFGSFSGILLVLATASILRHFRSKKNK